MIQLKRLDTSVSLSPLLLGKVQISHPREGLLGEIVEASNWSAHFYSPSNDSDHSAVYSTGNRNKNNNGYRGNNKKVITVMIIMIK